MAQSKKEGNKDNRDPTIKRLDAIIRVVIESNKIQNPKFDDAVAIKALRSVDLTLAEIAKIIGWKSTGSVANMLKGKKKPSKKKTSKKK